MWFSHRVLLGAYRNDSWKVGAGMSRDDIGSPDRVARRTPTGQTLLRTTRCRGAAQCRCKSDLKEFMVIMDTATSTALLLDQLIQSAEYDLPDCDFRVETARCGTYFCAHMRVH